MATVDQALHRTQRCHSRGGSVLREVLDNWIEINLENPEGSDHGDRARD
jgi:hypothetical protein